MGMTMSKKSMSEKHGDAGKRKHLTAIAAKLKMMSAAGKGAHVAAYKIALRGK
jgi:hypothetical protein